MPRPRRTPRWYGWRRTGDGAMSLRTLAPEVRVMIRERPGRRMPAGLALCAGGTGKSPTLVGAPLLGRARATNNGGGGRGRSGNLGSLGCGLPCQGAVLRGTGPLQRAFDALLDEREILVRDLGNFRDDQELRA